MDAGLRGRRGAAEFNNGLELTKSALASRRGLRSSIQCSADSGGGVDRDFC